MASSVLPDPAQPAIATRLWPQVREDLVLRTGQGVYGLVYQKHPLAERAREAGATGEHLHDTIHLVADPKGSRAAEVIVSPLDPGSHVAQGVGVQCQTAAVRRRRRRRRSVPRE